LSTDEAIQIFEEMFLEWENVSTTKIKFEEDDPQLIDKDIDQTNYLPYFLTTQPLGYTPIIFDTNGSIIDKLYGENASLQFLGFGGPVFADRSGHIIESLLIINGIWYNNIQTSSDPERSLNDFKTTIAHELGHVQGLDHSQINVNSLNLGATQELKDSVPLMFPIGISELPDLRQDDKSSVSLLYPNENGLTNFGIIKGKVFREDGNTPVLGTNVIARNLDDPTFVAISCVSDYLVDGTGSFSLTAVPPGKYTIEVEPINPLFSGNSTVGLYAKNLCDSSFLYPVVKGYYSGPNSFTTADKDSASILDLEAGKTIDNINVIATTDVGASRHLQCNALPPNFSASSSSSSNLNLLCCQGFIERQENQICPSNYTITFCETLHLHGCCPNSTGSSSSSSGVTSPPPILPTPILIVPDCPGTKCGNLCCIAGCCESNPSICSNFPECKKVQDVTSSPPTTTTSSPPTSPTNSLTNKPDFSPPNIIEPPIFITPPLNIDSTSTTTTTPTTTPPSNTINKPSTSFVEVSSVPNFPKIVEIPLVAEEFVGTAAFAYPGSNPSLEIKLPSDQIKSTIFYVHLKDNAGNTFQNIPFNITKIPSTPEKIILSLQLPDQVSAGKLKFTLFLHTGKLISGFINIINYLNIQFPNTGITIEKPIINSITESKSDQTITLIVKGKDFVGNKVRLTTNLADIVSLKSLSGPQTTTTIFPSSLNIQIDKLSVAKSGNQLEIKFTAPETLTKKTNATLVITTPRGIISKSFVFEN